MVIWPGSCDLLSNIIIQRIHFLLYKNQLMIIVIVDYYVSFLFSATYVFTKTENILCYNFTYNQRPRRKHILWKNNDFLACLFLTLKLMFMHTTLNISIFRVISFIPNINVINNSNNYLYIKLIYFTEIFT